MLNVALDIERPVGLTRPGGRSEGDFVRELIEGNVKHLEFAAWPKRPLRRRGPNYRRANHLGVSAECSLPLHNTCPDAVSL
jgi:hypothetical protein